MSTQTHQPNLAIVLTSSRFEYLWQDSENFKRPTKMPAPTYIEHLMGWVQSNIDNEAVFPSRIGECTQFSVFLNAPAKIPRRSVSKVIPINDSSSLQEDVPCLCAHILSSLPCCARAGVGGSLEHQLQALCAFY